VRWTQRERILTRGKKKRSKSQPTGGGGREETKRLKRSQNLPVEKQEETERRTGNHESLKHNASQSFEEATVLGKGKRVLGHPECRWKRNEVPQCRSNGVVLANTRPGLDVRRMGWKVFALVGEKVETKRRRGQKKVVGNANPRCWKKGSLNPLMKARPSGAAR